MVQKRYLRVHEVKEGIEHYRYEEFADYQTLWFSAKSFITRATNGAAFQDKEYATNDINLNQYLFDGVTEEGIQIQISVPDLWDRGAILAKIYWDAAAGASADDKVSWGISGGALSDDDAIDAALGDQIVVDDGLVIVGDIHITPVSGAVIMA